MSEQVDVIPAMANLLNIFQYIFPALMVSIAVVLLCFYLHAKKKRAAYDVTIATARVNRTVAVHTVSLSGEREEMERCYDRFPPRYSSVEHPPPYSLFDPKLSILPGMAPPSYDMYPIMLPTSPSHHWDPTVAPPPSEPNATAQNHPPTRRSPQTPPQMSGV